ncbi:MAG TPA: chromosomal replication initiator protein DnaA [Thermopetrobacter sp.]|nr:chromosomal replication initiator protein DnaA [Thermopetrobacter sp.]
MGSGANVREGWQKITKRLRAELGKDLFTNWFGRMEMEGCADGCLTVSVPTRFLKSWIETHYHDLLTSIAAAEIDGVRRVVIKVRSAARLPAPAVAAAGDDAGAAPLNGTPPLLSDHGSPLDPALTFDTFVSGPTNALALAAARRVAGVQSGASVNLNPLYIHSAAGLGKTHLLNAVAWHLRKHHPGRRLLYISAERFMYQFLAALKKRDTLSFKDRFQSIEVLLIDDFQFLQGRTMQEEFCHTFNSLVDARRQVVIAADMPPSQLEKIDEHMRSRLMGGLVVDIEEHDQQLRRAILERKLAAARARDPRLMISEEVLDYIAASISGGGRELEGALNRVIATQSLLGGDVVSVDMAAAALKNLSRQSATQPVRIEDILRIVGRHYNVPKADILSPRRARSIVLPRQVGMYLAKKLTSRSLPEIGRRFGGRDHSTVLHAVRKIETALQNDERLQRDIALLTRLLEQR